jgi:DNA replication and repair protein RecF
VWLTHLDLTQWRNHASTHLVLDKGVSTFVGPNGQGKTNIVEALRYLATLSSHRVGGTQALIGDGFDQATLHATLQHGDRSVEVGLTLKRKGASEALVNGNKTKASDIPAWVSMVMFAPEDISIVRGDPGTRRQFMDDLVVSGSPRMAGVFQDFDKVLKQRNTLLKSLKHVKGSTSLGTLDVWDERFADLGAHIMLARQAHVDHIAPLVTQQYQQLAVGDDVSLRYVSSAALAGTDGDNQHSLARALLAGIQAKRKEEIDRGMTLVGPHRDDLDVFISSRLARTHASQGETWSLALALRLATALWLRRELASGDPIIILDDVFSELDSSRRRKLIGLVQDYEQLLVTSAVEEDLPPEFGGRVFDVSSGVVSSR